jgi:hypothetical protein
MQSLAFVVVLVPLTAAADLSIDGTSAREAICVAEVRRAVEDFYGGDRGGNAQRRCDLVDGGLDCFACTLHWDHDDSDTLYPALEVRLAVGRAPATAWRWLPAGRGWSPGSGRWERVRAGERATIVVDGCGDDETGRATIARQAAIARRVLDRCLGGDDGGR